jgi:hypothetical protein
MPDGHIDNFLIPCFCRKLFEDKHPTKSGRHYFFSYVGVFLILNPLNVIISSLMLGYVVMINSLFFQQESILDFSSSLHENIVRTSFLGAASASKGKRLDLSDRVCCITLLYKCLFFLLLYLFFSI